MFRFLLDAVYIITLFESQPFHRKCWSLHFSGTFPVRMHKLFLNSLSTSYSIWLFAKCWNQLLLLYLLLVLSAQFTKNFLFHIHFFPLVTPTNRSNSFNCTWNIYIYTIYGNLLSPRRKKKQSCIDRKRNCKEKESTKIN